MNTLRRSFLYVRRKRTNLILLFLLIILFTVALTSAAIFRGSQEAQKNIRESLGGSFKMEAIISDDPAYKKITTLPNGGTISSYVGPLIDEKMIQTVLKHDGVVNYSVDNWMTVYIDDISLFPGLYQGIIEKAGSDPQYAATMTEEEMSKKNIYKQATGLYGCTDSSLHHYFQTGSFELCAGRPITDQDSGVVLISDKLAEKNGIKLGDYLKAEMRECLYLYDGAVDKNLVQPLNLEVIGFFHVNSSQSVNKYTAEDQIADNLMFASVSDIKTLDDYGGYDTEYDKVTFFVQDPKKLNSIIESIESDSSIEWANFYVEEDDSLYSGAIKPLKHINIFLSVLIIATFGITFFIFYMILASRVKDRKREIGIYLSIGISKKKILLQLIMECMVILIAAYIIAGAVSAKLADQTGGFILSAFTPKAEAVEEISEQELMEQIRNGSTEELFEIQETSGTPKTIDSSLSVSILLGLYFTLNLLLLAAVFVSSRPILRMKPGHIFQDYY